MASTKRVRPRSTAVAAAESSGEPAAPFASYREPLERATELALGYLEGLPERFVWAETGAAERLEDELGGPLEEDGEAPESVVERLAAAAEPGLTAMNGPRFFGFVIGGTLPAALAADWLAAAWDQNAALRIPTPAAAAVEAIAARWLLDLLRLPGETSVGFTTGATTANLVCVAAARHEILRRAGWDVDGDGLQGAPRITVVVGDEAHPSLLKALRLAGFGQRAARRVAVDDQGRMLPDALARTLDGLVGPTIVAAQLGNVNTGACDPLAEIAPIVGSLPNAWLHVDGAFGLWAVASPRLAGLASGLEAADSAATDAHKWLNVPYDSGLAFVRTGAAMRASMGLAAAYLPASREERDPSDYVPELSRRARGFPVYAALRSLGRRGVAALVERNCELAALMAERLALEPELAILNDVVLNQVLVRFGDSDEVTREVVRRVEEDGTCWAGGTVWRDRAAMRISVSGWSTGRDDALRSVEAIVRCARQALGARSAASPDARSQASASV